MFCKQIIIILMIAFFIEASQKRSFIHSINKVKIEELACDHKCWNAHSHIITIQKICQLGNTNIASVTRYDVTRSLEVVVGSINLTAHVDYDILLQYHIKLICRFYNNIRRYNYMYLLDGWWLNVYHVCTQCSRMMVVYT